MSVSTENTSTSGVLAEMGWGDVDEAGRLGGAAGSALLLAVATTYWGLTWLASGLAPLLFVASHIRGHRAR